MGEGNERHAVTIPKPFAVGKYEVTLEEWDACVQIVGVDSTDPMIRDGVGDVVP